MRLTDFWQRMDTRFGSAYAHSLARDYRLTALGASVEEALASGVDVKDVWRAVCGEFDVPSHLR